MEFRAVKMSINFKFSIMKNNKSVANWKAKFFQSMKELIVAHLKGISNQEVKVPIPGVYENISVRNLILEIEKETLIGVKYMIEYIKTIALINEAKKSN